MIKKNKKQLLRNNIKNERNEIYVIYIIYDVYKHL